MHNYYWCIISIKSPTVDSFASLQFTYADIATYMLFDYIVSNLPGALENYPTLAKQRESVHNLKNIAQWLKERPETWIWQTESCAWPLELYSSYKKIMSFNRSFDIDDGSYPLLLLVNTYSCNLQYYSLLVWWEDEHKGGMGEKAPLPIDENG